MHQRHLCRGRTTHGGVQRVGVSGTARPVQHARLVAVAPAHATAVGQRATDVAYDLKKARLVASPSLSLPAAAIDALFASRSGSKRGANLPLLDSPGPTKTSPSGAVFKAINVVLAVELDGVVLPRQQVVELRFYSTRRAVRVHNHKSFDLLENRLLVGWRRDAEGRLVAVVRSATEGAMPEPSTSRSASSLSPTPRRRSATPGATRVQPAEHAPGKPAQPQSRSGNTGNSWLARNGAWGSFGQVAGSSTPAASHLPVVPAQPSSNPSAAGGGSRFVQQLAHSAAGAAAHAAAMIGRACTSVVKPADASSAAGSSAPVPRARQRTFVPGRVRPVLNEVYLPYGVWRDLFGAGHAEQFPSEGLPLRVSITGSVHLSEQNAVLVRRCTPHGYFLLRGLKGLNRLKGKLMVRWHLLMNGVLELEVVDAMPNGGVPKGAAGVSRGAAAANIVNAPAHHGAAVSVAHATGAPSGQHAPTAQPVQEPVHVSVGVPAQH